MDTWRWHAPPAPRPGALRIFALGYHHARRLEEAPWASHPRHALLWITQGSGHLYEDGRTWPIRSGNVYRLVPGRRQRHGPLPGTTWQEHWISFHGPAADALMHDLIRADSPVLAVAGAERLNPLHQDIRAALAGLEPGAQRQAGVELHRLIAAIAALRDAPPDDVVSEALARMAAAALSGAFDAQAFCRRHGLPYHRFRRLFVRRVGQAPLRHFLDLRMRAAGELLLADPALPVAAVAARMGMETPWFSRLFARHVGTPPAAWRRGVLAC